MEIVQQLLDSAKQSVLLCLRNPYDAGVLSGAGTVVCTCSDSMPSLKAAVDVLTGVFVPAAKLPVPLTLD